MFQGRDVAVVIQTKAFASLSATEAINYGALLTCDGNSSGATNKPTKYSANIAGGNLAASKADGNATITTDAALNFISTQAKSAYVIKFSDDTTTGVAIHRPDGAPNYVGYLHNTNGLVDSSYDTIGTTELGNAAYLLSSSRFSSVLIKDPTGSIIGIFFKQLQ